MHFIINQVTSQYVKRHLEHSERSPESGLVPAFGDPSLRSESYTQLTETPYLAHLE